MGIRTITGNVQIFRHFGPVSAGTTDIVPTIGFDTQQYRCDRVAFIVMMGAIASDALVAVVVEESDDDDIVDPYVAVPGGAILVPNDGDNKLHIVEVSQWRKRFLRSKIQRNEGVGTAALQGILIVTLGAGTVPVDNSATRLDASISGLVVRKLGPLYS